MTPLHTAWNIGANSFNELIRRGLDRGHALHAVVDESGLPLLGDDLIPDPSGVRTLTVDAAASLPAVRPWLGQMFRGGGVYGWRSLESDDARSTDMLLTDLPAPAPGDRFGDLLEVARVDDGREIVWIAGATNILGNHIDGMTLDYLLHPVAEGRTRLVGRIRLDAPHLTRQVLLFILDAIELALTGSQLNNLRARAEAGPRPGRAQGLVYQHLPFHAASVSKATH